MVRSSISCSLKVIVGLTAKAWDSPVPVAQERLAPFLACPLFLGYTVVKLNLNSEGEDVVINILCMSYVVPQLILAA